jgi:hypothetical protein
VSLFRRVTRAAGYSWRTWDDPIAYRRPWRWDLLFWGACIDVGIWAAVAVLR